MGDKDELQELRRLDELELKYQVPPPPSGIPHGVESRAGQDVEEISGAAGTFVKKSALPTIGSVALPAAMTATIGPANIPFIPLEQGVGSGIGELANQFFGITELDALQVGVATVSPIVMGYGTNLLRTGKVAPAALQTKAPQMATSQLRNYRSATPSKALFEQAARQGHVIPLTKTGAAIQALRTELQQATPASRRAFERVMRDTGLDDLLQQVQTANVTRIGTVQTAQGVNPVQMQHVLTDIGKMQSQAAREGGLRHSHLSRLFGAMKDDLEESGSGLAFARRAFKREAVLDDLEDAIGRAMFVKKGQGAQTEFSANKILNTLNRTDEGLGKFFSQAFTGKEQGEIKELFSFLNTLPSLRPGAGQTFGSGQFFERMSRAGAGGGVGAATGFALGGPTGAAVGGALGLGINEATQFGKLMLQAWRMPGGRTVVKNLLLNADGAATPYVVSTLTAFVTSARSKPTTPTLKLGETGNLTTLRDFYNVLEK